MTDQIAQLQPFFDAYAACFDDADAPAIADLYALPAVIWQFSKGHIFDHADDLTDNAETLIDAFEEAGIVETRATVTTATVAGDSAFAAVDWTQFTAGGEMVHAFACRYLLTRQEDDWHIATVVNVDAIDADVDADAPEPG